MKKQFLTFFTVLLALTNWLHTANAQPTTTITPPSGTQIGVFDVTVTFSEAVTGFDQTELSVTGTANATITAWTAGGKDYVATITPTKDGMWCSTLRRTLPKLARIMGTLPQRSGLFRSSSPRPYGCRTSIYADS